VPHESKKERTCGDLGSRLPLRPWLGARLPTYAYSQSHELFLPQQVSPVDAEFITLCSAEYQIMMGRITNWTVLQYALWPIVIGFYAFIADHADDVPAALLPWLLAAVLPVGYLAYQSAMIDALNYILLVERQLRPQAARIVGRTDFWTWESTHRHTRKPNPAYWYGWPPLFSVISVAVGLFYSRRGHYQPWWVEPLCFAVTSLCALVVYQLTLEGRRLDRAVNTAVGLSESGKPLPGTDAGARGLVA